MKLSAFGQTHTGLRRIDNQDRFLIKEDKGVFAIFDGMGGHPGGAQAADIAKDSFDKYVNVKYGQPLNFLLRNAILYADQKVKDFGRQPQFGKAGTTAISVGISREQTVISHVGDSRVYLRRDGCVLRQTTDHTFVEELIYVRNIPREIAQLHPNANVLLQCLGGGIREPPEVRSETIRTRVGDRFLLCSDGLYNYVSRLDIDQTLCLSNGPEEVTEVLIDLTLRGGGGDNVTAVVIDVKE